MADYEHDRSDTNLNNLHRAMKYAGDGEPSLRVSIEQVASTADMSITAGDLSISEITGSVEITNEVGSPIPVSGIISLDASTISALTPTSSEITGSVEITNEVGSPIPVSGIISLDASTISALTPTSSEITGSVEITNEVGSPIPVSGIISLDASTISALTPTSSEITGSVTITNEADDPIPINGIISLDASTISELTPVSSLQWKIQVSAGVIPGYSSIEKFGRCADVSTSTNTTIWDNGGNLPTYQYATLPTTLSAISDDTSDTSNGSGARTVSIQGLDQDYILRTEILVVGGPASTNTYLRIFRASVVTAGVTGSNEGNIDIIDSSANVLARISKLGNNVAGAGQTFMAMYTVPAGKTAYITQWSVSSSKQNADTLATLLIKSNDINAAWNTKDIVEIQSTNYLKDYNTPIRVPEKYDIEVRAITSTGASVASSFNIILIDN